MGERMDFPVDMPNFFMEPKDLDCAEGGDIAAMITFSDTVGNSRKRRFPKTLLDNEPVEEEYSADQLAGLSPVDGIDLLCPLCRHIFVAPHEMTCGHTFCYNCFLKNTVLEKVCPICRIPFTNLPLTPNERLSDLCTTIIAHRKKLIAEYLHVDFVREVFDSPEAADITKINVESLRDIIFQILEQNRFRADYETAEKNRMTDKFLKAMIARKERQLQELQQEIVFLRRDQECCSKLYTPGEDSDDDEDEMSNVPSSSTILDNSVPSVAGEGSFSGGERLELYGYSRDNRLLGAIDMHGEHLLRTYRAARKGFPHSVRQTQPGGALYRYPAMGFDEFGDVLKDVTKYNKIERVSKVSYHMDSSAGIVSSVEFDPDAELFVFAGVTRKIKIFNFANVYSNPEQRHYPLHQLESGGKVSNVAWNPKDRKLLAAGDYEGVVTLYDVESGKIFRRYIEHDKRCWSVNFNKVDTSLLASGSDDGKVKLWSVHSDRSVVQMDVRVNVCSVNFSPVCRNTIVFGGADHCLHVYDLRQTKTALSVLKGHGKAISYAKFIDEERVVTASTDNSLRVWNIRLSTCEGQMTGHLNEKNFVGLSVEGQYIVCGSEKNAIHVYYAGLPTDIAFCPMGGASTPSVPNTNHMITNDFVSAVAWKPNTNIILGANSRGIVQIFRLS